MDRFTLIHLGIGFCYQRLGLSMGVMLLLAIAWEIIENPLKAHLPHLFPHATADTLQNVSGDVCAVIAGWSAAHYFMH